MSGGVDRAREDAAAGRHWKARDRLLGLLSTEPANAEALELLGEVYAAMGDAPRAAGPWLLAGRNDAEFAEAYAALEERTGADPALILRALPLKGPVDGFPATVQSRIRELADSAAASGGVPRRVRRWLQVSEPTAPGQAPSRLRTFARQMGCLTLMALAGILLVGMVVGVGLEISLVVTSLRSGAIDPALALCLAAAGLVVLVAWLVLRRGLRVRPPAR